MTLEQLTAMITPAAAQIPQSDDDLIVMPENNLHPTTAELAFKIRQIEIRLGIIEGQLK